VLNLGLKDPEVSAAAEDVYTKLLARGVDAFLDDRDERPGVKFKDADLLGFPVRITVGKRFKDNGLVEVRCRKDGTTQELSMDSLIDTIMAQLAEQNSRG
jgi:prolyl-tRNA synthetase